MVIGWFNVEIWSMFVRKMEYKMNWINRINERKFSAMIIAIEYNWQTTNQTNNSLIWKFEKWCQRQYNFFYYDKEWIGLAIQRVSFNWISFRFRVKGMRFNDRERSCASALNTLYWWHFFGAILHAPPYLFDMHESNRINKVIEHWNIKSHTCKYVTFIYSKRFCLFFFFFIFVVLRSDRLT